MDDETVETWNELADEKGRRARRRELEAVREPGRLRKWLAAHDLWMGDVSTREVGLFNQFIRAYRHSCHAACCVIDQFEKRHTARRDRQMARQELRRWRQ